MKSHNVAGSPFCIPRHTELPRPLRRSRVGLALTVVGLLLLPARHSSADMCVTPLLENEPVCNAALSDSPWPISHRGSYAQGSAASVGPEPGQTVTASHVNLPGPPITLAFSPEYGDGAHAIWGAVLGTTGAIVKLDSDTFSLIDSYVPADEEAMPPTIPLGVGGAYSAANTEFQYLLGRVNFVEVYGDSIPGDRSSPIELVKRVTLPTTSFCRTSDLLVGGVMLPDGHLAVVSEQAVVSVMPSDASSLTPASVVSAPSENGADCGNLLIPAEDLETVSNSMAADENGGIYIVTDAAVVKYQWDGATITKVWRTEYLSDAPFSVLRLGPGSGSTPSLMGTALEDDRFVVVTDGQELMHLVVMWRDEVPVDWQPIAPGRDPRIACEVPVTFGVPNAIRSLSEQSVLVRGYSSVVVNNLLKSEIGIPTAIGAIAAAIAALRGSDPNLAPHGAERIDWDPVSRTCSTVWTNTEVSLPNAIPTMSAATGLIHAIGQREGAWGLETLDFHTGESVDFTPSVKTTCDQSVLDAVAASVVGPFLMPTLNTYPASCENSIFAATEVGPDGTVYTGTFQGASRFQPDSVGEVSPRRQARAGVAQGEDAAARGIAALPAAPGLAHEWMERAALQVAAAQVAITAADGPELDSNSASHAGPAAAAALGHLVAAEALIDSDAPAAAAEMALADADLAEAARWLSPCPPAPQSGCRTPDKATLQVKLDGAKSNLKWNWRTAVEVPDLTSPITGADYALCLYDSALSDPIAELHVAGRAAGWKRKRDGFQFKDKTNATDGVGQLSLAEKVGKGGKAKLGAKGAGVPTFSLPAAAPLVVQLVNSSSSLCWETIFEASDLKKNEAGKLKGVLK